MRRADLLRGLVTVALVAAVTWPEKAPGDAPASGSGAADAPRLRLQARGLDPAPWGAEAARPRILPVLVLPVSVSVSADLMTTSATTSATANTTADAV